MKVQTMSSPLTDDELVLEDFFGSGDVIETAPPIKLETTSATTKMVIMQPCVENATPVLVTDPLVQTTVVSTTKQLVEPTTAFTQPLAEPTTTFTEPPTELFSVDLTDLSVESSGSTNIDETTTETSWTTMIATNASNTTVVNNSTGVFEPTTIIPSNSVNPKVFWSLIVCSIAGWAGIMVLVLFLHKKRRRYTPNDYTPARLSPGESLV